MIRMLFNEIWETYSNRELEPSKLYISKQFFDKLMTDKKTMTNTWYVGEEGKLGITMFGVPMYVNETLETDFKWIYPDK